MKKIITILFFIYNHAFAQENIVPNPGFEQGPNEPQCFDHYSSGNAGDANDFDDDIENWRQAKPSAFQNNHSSDWEGPNCNDINTQKCGNTFLGGRYVTFSQNEGIRVMLNEVLKAGHKYVFRCWARFPVENSVKIVEIHFSNGPSWWDNNEEDNEIFRKAVTIVGNPKGEASCKWFIFQQTFEVDARFGSTLETMVFDPKNSNNFFDVDNIELFEFCPDTMRIINKNYVVSDILNEAKNIRAGLIHGIQAPNQYNVIVSSENKVTFKAERQIKLQRGFNAKAGCEFRAYIAPCGVMCSPSIDDYSHLTKLIYTLCNDLFFGVGINIGSQSISGFQYKWSSTNPDHLKYLDKTNISNPVFKIPSWDQVTTNITYTLTISDKCGNSTTDIVLINFSEYNYNASQFIVAGYVPSTYVYDPSINSFINIHSVGYLDIWLSLASTIVKINVIIRDHNTGKVVISKAYIQYLHTPGSTNYNLYRLNWMGGLIIGNKYDISFELEDFCGLTRTENWHSFIW